MSYLSSHKTRIRKRYNYSKGALEAGMIVELTYKRRVKKGDPSRLETKKYMAGWCGSYGPGLCKGAERS